MPIVLREIGVIVFKETLDSDFGSDFDVERIGSRLPSTYTVHPFRPCFHASI